MTLAFTVRCGCGVEERLPSVLAGSRGRCRGCGATVQAPGERVGAAAPAAVAEVEEEQPPLERGQARVITVHPQGPTAKLTKARLRLEFACQSCGENLRAPLHQAGLRGRCIHCQGEMRIPYVPGEDPGAGLPNPLETPRAETPAAETPAAETPAATAPAATAPAETAPAATAPAPAPRPSGINAFKSVRVSCACGRQVSVPRAILAMGSAKCPGCAATLR